MRRFRIRSRNRTQSFGGFGDFVGGRVGSNLGSRLGKLFGRRFGKRFGRKMANKYLPPMLWKLGGALLPGLPIFFMENKLKKASHEGHPQIADKDLRKKV